MHRPASAACLRGSSCKLLLLCQHLLMAAAACCQAALQFAAAAPHPQHRLQALQVLVPLQLSTDAHMLPVLQQQH
jgi:hypothetical protein